MATTSASYSPAQRRLHWIVAILIFALIAVGLYIPTISDDPAWNDYKMRVYDVHKWTGILVLVLALGRLALRLRRPVAPDPGLLPWERTLSKVVHGSLYALMIAMPLLGWTSSSALGFPVVWFGVLPLPDLVPRHTELGFALLRAHQTLAWALIALLALHVAGALWHAVVRKDGVLRRMTGGAAPGDVRAEGQARG
jgi:cytochrome b561